MLVALATACPKRDNGAEKSDQKGRQARSERESAPRSETGGSRDPDTGAESEAGSDAAAASATGGEEGTPVDAQETADAGAQTSGAEGTTGPDHEPAADPKALLKEARSKRTKDQQAMELLAQAEEAGAKPREVAKAATDRGLALHGTPERAAKLFEWAAEKDAAYPDPVWHLAKQAAVQGNVDRTKELLAKVHERGGKKLLQQIEFDPMWEIVKDDPDVRALLR